MSSRVADHVRGNLYGLIAIFIALSGTAYAVDGPLAGQNQVGTADIINAEVLSEDIASGQVGTAKLAAGAVNAAKIADGEVRAAEIAQGGVGTSEVANDSLIGGDIANGSLTSSDLAKHTIVRDDLAFEIAEPLTAAVASGGRILGGNGVTRVDTYEDRTGVYYVYFGDLDVQRCVPQATLMDRLPLPGNNTPPNGEISVVWGPDLGGSGAVVLVRTWDSAAFGGAPPAAADRHFFLTVNC